MFVGGGIMAMIRIRGGRPLHGEYTVPGSKNGALPILAASILCSQGPVTLLGCPHLSDVENMLALLRHLGCQTRWEGDALTIDAQNARVSQMPEELAKVMRSSIFMLGPLLGRFGSAVATYPGGCDIGLRPIDLHLKGLRTLGARITEQAGYIFSDGAALKGGMIHLDYPSVGATENLMMAAALTPGTTRLTNAAREPEIVQLQDFLRAMGADISGAGTETITINGVERLSGCSFPIAADRIVAGTFLVAAAITGGEIALRGAPVEQLAAVEAKLREAGCTLEKAGALWRLRAPAKLGAIESIETQPYPGFPTDMQALFLALCTRGQGASVITENIFENRFRVVPQLARMGARIRVSDRTAIVHGPGRLTGAGVTAPDLRGGAALVVAALAAEGETRIGRVDLIDRGYEHIEQDLSALGADAVRIEG